jgi:hypothetical protein
MVGGHSAGPHDLEPGDVVHGTNVYGTVNSEHTMKIVPAENETFRAYLVVRPLKLAEQG